MSSTKICCADKAPIRRLQTNDRNDYQMRPKTAIGSATKWRPRP